MNFPSHGKFRRSTRFTFHFSFLFNEVRKGQETSKQSDREEARIDSTLSKGERGEKRKSFLYKGQVTQFS